MQRLRSATACPSACSVHVCDRNMSTVMFQSPHSPGAIAAVAAEIAETRAAEACATRLLPAQQCILQVTTTLQPRACISVTQHIARYHLATGALCIEAGWLAPAAPHACAPWSTQPRIHVVQRVILQ